MRNFFLTTALVFSFLLLTLLCHAQKGTVTGKVLGIDGALYGATISVGTATALTDRQGKFSVALSPGYYTLLITHVGYKKITRDIKVDAGNSFLQMFTMTPDEEMDEVVVLGSRSNVQRSNLSTPVPVDVVSSRQLLQTGQTSLTQMLQFTVPSFNASRQVVNEPVTLRGLDPDQVLILVNGKRYHNMSFVNWGGVRGILGRGSVSNDLNSIPFSAIEKVEILEDGASAQYGSDAIAGVINIQLKNSPVKTSAQIHTGQFYKGDGENVSIGVNHGFAIGKKLPAGRQGFLNFSGAYRFQNITYRGGHYDGTVYTNNLSMDDSIVKARNFDRNKVSNAGASKHNGFGLTMNGGYELGKQTELFITTGVNHRKTVYKSGYSLPKNASRINPELFPNGFQPRPSNHTNDVWSILGIKGNTINNWQWEYSITYGNNWAKYYNKQTNNASQFYSLGKDAPTTFYTGSLIYGQFVNNIQAIKNISVQNGKMINLGFGTEWRLEHFQIKEGEEASWKNYDTRKRGGSGGLVFNPRDVIKENRAVVSGYVDIESEFANRFLLNVASRYEYYNDFGGNLAGKLAIRYKFTERFALRGSVSNGFRAPSLQQRYYGFTRIGPPDSSGIQPLLGIFRNNSNVAAALGIPSLTAERSINLSGGFTANIHQTVRLTADAYWIQIKNRIVLSGVFERTNREVDSLLRGLADVDQVQFFTNAINTRTKGINIVLNGNWKIKNANLSAMLAANFTKTRLFGEIQNAGNLKADPLNTNTLFGRGERGNLEKGQPQDKIIFFLQYETKNIGLLLRNTRFGKTAILSSDLLQLDDEEFSPKILTDISLTYSLKKSLTITIGANNVFNIYPDRIKDYRNTNDGIYIYGMEATPFGFNGGYYFLSIEIKW
jgi:iron complex outermembrane receptor protein